MRAVDRRTFCKLVGGGIVVLVTAKPADLFAQQRRGYPEDLNAYLRIDENGRVTLFSGKIEMGQGVHTSLAQMAAEELGVSLDAITVVMGDTDQCPWDAGTWSLAAANETSWSGGNWNGYPWTGTAWTSASWTGNAWGSVTWTRNSWSGTNWSRNSWSRNSWSRNSWSSKTWTRSSWSSNTFARQTWSTAKWG